MWGSTFVLKTILKRSIRRKQTDRTCWTIQTPSDELNWARRRTFNSLTLVGLMKSSTFALGLRRSQSVENSPFAVWHVAFTYHKVERNCVMQLIVWTSKFFRIRVEKGRYLEVSRVLPVLLLDVLVAVALAVARDWNSADLTMRAMLVVQTFLV